MVVGGCHLVLRCFSHGRRFAALSVTFPYWPETEPRHSEQMTRPHRRSTPHQCSLVRSAVHAARAATFASLDPVVGGMAARIHHVSQHFLGLCFWTIFFGCAQAVQDPKRAPICQCLAGRKKAKKARQAGG